MTLMPLLHKSGHIKAGKWTIQMASKAQYTPHAPRIPTCVVDGGAVYLNEKIPTAWVLKMVVFNAAVVGTRAYDANGMGG